VDVFAEQPAGWPPPPPVPVHVDLVVSAETLFGADDEPAEVPGCGPVPASLAREMVIASPEERTRIRRLFRFEETDRLVAMEPTSRIFRGLRALLIRIRDRSCRTPYCNGDIKHGDHIVPVRAGGETTQDNAQGLCEACNYIKEEPGWRYRVVSQALDQHTVQIITPGGQTIRSRAPDPPRRSARSQWIEIHPGRWILAA
jgi:HNH endonuclease